MRLPLYHATHSSVANSTALTPFHGPRRWISSALNNPITLSAKGRTSRRLNIAGVKVDPLEIERVILALPQVSAATVSSVAGERGMEVITARVVVAGGREISREALVAHCRRELA